MTSSSNRRPRRSAGNYEQNHGRPGVLYILFNPGLRDGWWKIGCSTRSGRARAQDLNIAATTGTPGIFECVFEHSTLDCGLAEQLVFEKLAFARRGKFGQEYFEVSLQDAVDAIEETCLAVDDEVCPRPPPPPAPPPLPPPLPQSSKTAPAPATQASSTKAKSIEPQQSKKYSGPERFCGHCRTWAAPKRSIFRSVCKNCGLAL